MRGRRARWGDPGALGSDGSHAECTSAASRSTESAFVRRHGSHTAGKHVAQGAQALRGSYPDRPCLESGPHLWRSGPGGSETPWGNRSTRIHRMSVQCRSTRSDVIHKPRKNRIRPVNEAGGPRDSSRSSQGPSGEGSRGRVIDLRLPSRLGSEPGPCVNHSRRVLRHSRRGRPSRCAQESFAGAAWVQWRPSRRAGQRLSRCRALALALASEPWIRTT